MIHDLPDSVLNVSLFGSTARNDNDKNSDLDVLIIVQDHSGTTSPDTISTHFNSQFGKIPSLSWYGLGKIQELFRVGDLFAWHLHLESSHVAGKTLREIAGSPTVYKTALADIEDLRRIAVGVEDNVRACPQNAVFEMGILYVCARNIAMPATWCLAERPSFGRYSPYAIPDIPFPISRDIYELAIESRMASQRGSVPPKVFADLVLKTQEQIVGWSDNVIRAIKQSEAQNEQI